MLRRMPISIKMPMPDHDARSDIFRRLLKDERLADDVNVKTLIEDTEGFSGSDIKELLRVAVLQKNRELSGVAMDDSISDEEKGLAIDRILARSICQADFNVAMLASIPTGRQAWVGIYSWCGYCVCLYVIPHVCSQLMLLSILNLKCFWQKWKKGM